MTRTSKLNLSTPLQLGALRLQHRLVVVGTSAAERSSYSLAARYRAKASEGGLSICALADGHQTDAAHLLARGITSANEVNCWLDVTQAIHASGGTAVGRIGESIALPGTVLNDDQIDAALDACRTAAENASDAGFDGVELAATLGTLPEQLESSPANPHGSGFLCDALRALFAAWPENRVGLNLSLPTTPADLRRLHHALRSIDTRALAYVHLQATGSGHAIWCKPYASSVRLHHRCALIISGRWTARHADMAIGSGKTDAVGLQGGGMPEEMGAAWRAQLKVMD